MTDDTLIKMQLIKNPDSMRAQSRAWHAEGKTLGFVPTMGALHEGHLSLVKKSLDRCDLTVVSVFINPTQFGENEDLDTYPVDLEGDRKMLEELGADVMFLPDRQSLYPEGYKTFVEVQDITTRLCGASRPVFFRGVSTVVLKLLNIVEPDYAFFGEKDRQQLQVVKTLVRDLNLQTTIVPCPIVREADGLAMSSRNQYLNAKERQAAKTVPAAIDLAESLIRGGERSATVIRQAVLDHFGTEALARVDYVSLCHPEDFRETEIIEDRVLVALAIWIGTTRLIDNKVIRS